jgi:hypothetical protein
MTLSQEESRPFALSHTNQLLEDHPHLGCGVRDNRADGTSFARTGGHKTARRWTPSEIRWECGHGAYSYYSESLEDSPDDGVSMPTSPTKTSLIDGSSKRRAFFGVSYPKKNTRT